MDINLKYKQIGRTGKNVSVIGFGGSRFRPEDHIGDNLDKCAELVLYAHSLGINYFDTAPNYCECKSELIYGHAFKQMKIKPYVSTKCGNDIGVTTADETIKTIEKSLKRLNLEKITFYYMWSIKNMNEYYGYVKKGGVYDGILKAKNEGLIEHICASIHSNDEDVIKIVDDGRVDVVMLGYNAFNFAYRRNGVKACADAGIGVVTMNPLGGGMIPRHPELFGFLSENNDKNFIDSAIRFLLGQKEINVALIGMFTKQHIDDAVRATEGIIHEISDMELNKMSALQSEKLNTLCTLCSYCKNCPVNIPIPQFMDCYNELIVTGEERFVKRRLKEHWNITCDLARKCIECKKCEKICTQHLPIIERLKYMVSFKQIGEYIP